MSDLGRSRIGFSDEKRVDTLKSKVIIYPKFNFSIKLECDRYLSCYISVKTKIIDDIESIGFTETRNYEAETVLSFTASFEVSYMVGIDDDQVLLFDIFDGDVMSLREGYLFSSLSVPVTALSKGEVTVPITRGPTILGYLHLFSELGVSPTNCTLDLTNDYHTAFFKVPRLIVDDIKDAFPQMVDISLKYHFNFKTFAVYKILKKFKIDVKSNYYLKSFMKICICESDETPDSEDLRLVWESNPVTKAPYEVRRKELQLGHDFLLGGMNTTNDRYLVFQIYAEGHDTKSDKTKLLLWAQMPLSDVINSEKAVAGVKTKRKFLQFQSNVGDERLPSIDKKKSSILAKLDFLHHDDSDNDSLDDEFDEGKNDNGQDDDDADDADDDADDDKGNDISMKLMNNAFKMSTKALNFSGTPKKPAKNNRFGKMSIAIEQNEEKTNLENGDAMYEKKIRVIYEKKSREWTENVRALFDESVVDQTENTLNSTENLECRIYGATFTMTILADVYTPALIDLVTKLQLPPDDPLQRSRNATFFGSTVLESVEDITHKFFPYLDKDKVKIYAMGTVTAPWRVENSPYEYVERSVSFPLGQELLLSALRDGSLHSVRRNIAASHIISPTDTLFSASNSKDFQSYIDPLTTQRSLIKKDVPRRHLEEFLKSGQWGASDLSAYARDTSYSSIESIKIGFAETTGIYCPAISIISSSMFSTDGLLADVNEQEKKRKMFSEKQFKYRLHACYSGSFVDSSPILFVDEMSKVLTSAQEVGNLEPFVPNLNTAKNFDADVLDFLLFDSSNRTASVSQLIIWVIGKCPSKKVLERLEITFQRIMIGETSRPLLMYLTCEPLLDLTSNNLEKMLSNQFSPLFDAFDKAVEDAKLCAKDLNIDKKRLLKSRKYPCKKSLYRSLGNMLTIYHNISFPEVLASAFIRDDDQNKVERENLQNSPNESEGSPEDDFTNLPRYTILGETLGLYFDKKTTSNMIGKATLTAQESEHNRRQTVLGEPASRRRSSMFVGDTIRGSLTGLKISGNFSNIAKLAKSALGKPDAEEETEEEKHSREEALRIKKHEEESMAARVPDMQELQRLSRAFKKFQNIGNSAFIKALTSSILKDLDMRVEEDKVMPIRQKTCIPVKAGCMMS